MASKQIFGGSAADDRRAAIAARYASMAAAHEADVRRLRRLGRLCVVAGLAAFVGAVGCAVAFTVVGGAWWLGVSALLLALYVAARWHDTRLDGRRLRSESLLTACRNELSYIDGDYSPFDDGQRFVNPKHPYTYDMDIFGPLSLYHRMCRAVTDGGAQYLARCLAGEATPRSKAFVDARREAIGRLAAMEGELMEFVAMRRHGAVRTDAVSHSASGVAAVVLPRWASARLVPVAMGAGMAATVALIALSALTALPSGVPFVWCMAMLAVSMGLAAKSLRTIGQAAERLHKQAAAYAELVGLIATTPMATVGDPALGQCSERDWRRAMEAFACLRQLLAALDRRGNFIGLVLGNAFTLSDMRLARRFSLWQRTYAADMGLWIERVSVVDGLVSMAMLRRNEPQASDAEIADGEGVELIGEDICHPFLGLKAVGNDFSISERHYYIVTGANMAGKSTFLRAIGVNYILASNGLPVFAARLRTTLFNLFTSMRTSDDLGHGISYFNAELLRLRQLIDSVKAEGHTLLILDEILKGTNSLDKLNGSRMFLNAMQPMPVAAIVATHDLELSRMADELPANFHNYCFEIGLGDTITYTYKIAPGVSRNQNATHLLRSIIDGLR